MLSNVCGELIQWFFLAHACVAMASLDFDLDTIISAGGSRPKRPRSDGEASVAAGALEGTVAALAALQISNAKLTLQNDLQLRNVSAAVEFVALLPKDNIIITSARAGRKTFEDQFAGKKGHGKGTPDIWAFRAAVLGLASVMPEEKDAILAIAASLTEPAHFMDMISTVNDKDCSDDHEYKGMARITFQFGSKGEQLKRLFAKYILTVDKAEIRPGRAARSALARDTQQKLDDLQKIMKKNK